MRAPRTTIPCSVSPVLCNGTGLPTKFGVGRPVDRRVDDGVGERDVLERELALEGDEVGMALDVRAVRAFPPAAFPGETRERHVHVVGGAAHQPHRRLGDAGQPVVAAHQIGLRPRDHVADVDLLAGLRVVHQALRPALELPIEDRRHRLGGLGERGMIGDVADSFVTDPDVRPAGGQRLQELVSGPRPHGQPPCASLGGRDRGDHRLRQCVARS